MTTVTAPPKIGHWSMDGPPGEGCPAHRPRMAYRISPGPGLEYCAKDDGHPGGHKCKHGDTD